VVADATVVTVRLTDKREFKAKVIGTDKRTDVALLKVDATGLPTVKLGDASRVKVGEWVMAVGSPFGFDSTVTAGIVSAKSRNLPDETLVPFIQTDVAINPGNSGGPLFNLDGEVIGINSQIYSRTGGYQGLSFAIPIDVAMQVKDQLQNHGRVSRGKLGVYIQPLTPELAQSFGVARPAGALVSSVEKGGPAERAGVQPGDVVMAVNGQPVETNVDLPRIIFSLRPGETVKLRLWRQNAAVEIPVTLGDLEPARSAAADPVEPATTGKLGLALRPLAAAEARELDVANGLLVERADGAAAKAGLQRGDVVLAVNGEPVFSVEQFSGLVTRAGSQIALLIQRGDSRLFVPVRIS
jgi:serine protease Do